MTLEEPLTFSFSTKVFVWGNKAGKVPVFTTLALAVTRPGGMKTDKDHGSLWSLNSVTEPTAPGLASPCWHQLGALDAEAMVPQELGDPSPCILMSKVMWCCEFFQEFLGWAWEVYEEGPKLDNRSQSFSSLNGTSTRCLLKEGWPLRRQAQSTVLTGTMVLLMKMHEVWSPSSWGGNSNPVLTGSSVSRGLTVCLPFTLLLGSQDVLHPPAVILDVVVQDAAVWDAVAWDVVVRDVVGWDAVVLDAAVRDAVVWDVVVWDAVIGTLQYGMLWSWMLQSEILWSGTHSSQLLLQWISFLWLPWNILNEQKTLDSLNKPKQNTIS